MTAIILNRYEVRELETRLVDAVYRELQGYIVQWIGTGSPVISDDLRGIATTAVLPVIRKLWEE